MKKIIFVLIAVLILSSVLMADEVVFDKVNRDEASNIQGQVEYWDGIQWVKASNEEVTLTLYYNNSQSHYEQVTMNTDENGNYSYNFNNHYSNSQWCDRVSVEFRSNVYYSSYDGIERIDIKWYKSF